ncbi:glyoxalase [Ktedonobacter sp. SOSP1-52]|uniref:VOC family protein n=1 Tax=Ktedonobacter sp. SOSP1-52 TaxID=2778366 RepID=UPI00191619F7|nr:VOC family protein [Ktedonobacter sp. SOSP1-52]GHO71149.1 glyoxalase [Ktedonobacter sp. SOSP1-52]
MALELYMLGLITQDMSKALEFYRRLGLAIPEGSEKQTHVGVKMGSGLTFFLDSNPSRWDPGFVSGDEQGHLEAADSYRSVLEFYLETQEAVDTKYAELTGFGYQGRRAPYKTSFGMYFALIDDPDGNTILLSGDLAANGTSEEG